MTIRALITIGLLLATPSGTARSDDDAFTQIGHWSFDYPAYERTGEFVCPSVKFPREFGSVPDIVFVNKGVNWGFITVSFRDITPQGFTPVLQRGGGKGNKPAGTAFADWIAVGEKLLRGNATAKYLVLTIIYSPPGTNGGHSTSSVSYQAGSTTGTTTSASQSFGVANTTSLDTSGGFLGNGGGVGISFEYSHSTSDNQSLEIKKTTSSTISQNGPSQDGINHDQDQIWLLLNPSINLALSPSSAAWMLANTQSPIQYVYVGWLNGHQPIPPGVASALLSAGITKADYPDILARDPLANGSPLDSRRYIALNTTFPYEPPYTSTDPVPTVSFSVSDSSISTVGSTTEDSYKVGLTMSATGNYLDFAKATLKDTLSWTWTNKSARSTSSGTSQSATVVVGGPAYGYVGNTLVEVYFDTIYKTFAFAIVPAAQREVAVKGTLADPKGSLLPWTEVTLVTDGTDYRTFTNSKGDFQFYGHLNGPSAIQAAGVTQTLPQVPSTIRHVAIGKTSHSSQSSDIPAPPCRPRWRAFGHRHF